LQPHLLYFPLQDSTPASNNKKAFLDGLGTANMKTFSENLNAWGMERSSLLSKVTA
jgi:hypothetical protein